MKMNRSVTKLAVDKILIIPEYRKRDLKSGCYLFKRKDDIGLMFDGRLYSVDEESVYRLESDKIFLRLTKFGDVRDFVYKNIVFVKVKVIIIEDVENREDWIENLRKEFPNITVERYLKKGIVVTDF
jgi:hypothetical protein